MLQKHSCVCYCACFDVFRNRLNRNAARDISRAVSAHAVGNNRYRFFVFGGYAAIVLIRTSPPRFSSVSINHLTFLVECFVGYSDKHICSLNRLRVCYNKPIAAGIKSILVRVCLSARPDRYACFGAARMHRQYRYPIRAEPLRKHASFQATPQICMHMHG